MQKPVPMHERNWRWKAEVHTHDAGTADLSSAVVSAFSRKSLAEPAGSFGVTLKGTDRPGGENVNPLGLISDDDWVLFGATDTNGNDWVISTGLVDGVRRQMVGTAGSKTYTVQGRDLGKVLIKTDLLDMPWLGTNLAAAYRTAFGAHLLINSIDPLEMSPGRAVAELLEYGLGGGVYRGPAQFWAVPTSIVTGPVPNKDPVDPFIRQASDILATDIDLDTSGIMSTQITIPTGIGAGGGLWSLLTQYANGLLNELHVDQIPTRGALSSPTAFIVGGTGFSRSQPTVRLRQRPFPSITVLSTRTTPDFGIGVTGSDSWRALPANEFPVTDLETYDVGRSGAERFNWISVDSAIGPEITQRSIMSMLDGTTPPERWWDGIPAVFATSIERHGLTRLQQATPFLTSSAQDQDLLIAKEWVRLLRDWYAPNPVFLSGTATIAYLAPGVRIGERFRVAMRDGTVEEFYIEAVEHRFIKRPDGSAHGSTTLSITRGWVLPDSSADYASAIEVWLRDNLESLT